ncbi:MAG: hypothetical protein HS104_34690 [Polyangiaceae bacterium]|nr:hypothetical protein [Polyangiaceae bacterium]
MKKLLAAAGGAAAVYVALTSFGACGNQRVESHEPDAAADADADVLATGGAPGDAPGDNPVPPWDPVWHKTTPASFPVLPPGPALKVDCGVRCKVISSSEPDGISPRRPRANDDWAVFQVAPGRVQAVHLASGVEYLVDDGQDWPGSFGAALPSLAGKRTFYAISKPDQTIMVVRDLTTGERKLVWAAPKLQAGDGSGTTAFAGPYLYWDHAPPSRFYRFDVRNGELKMVSGGGCFFMEGSETGFATCAGEGWIDLIDFDKGQISPVGDTQNGAAMGGISDDGKTIVWSDLRHPGPGGEKSTFFQPIAGSEIYRLDVASGKETRVTFDSPTKPGLKTFTRAVGDVVLWHSFQETSTPTPDTDLAWQASAPVWFQKAGGAIQRLRQPVDWVLYAQPITKGIVGIWVLKPDGGSNSAYLVSIDWPPPADGGTADGG